MDGLCVVWLLTEVKAKRKEEGRTVEAKEAFNSLDSNDDNM